jgi:hypothetical protein
MSSAQEVAHKTNCGKRHLEWSSVLSQMAASLFARFATVWDRRPDRAIWQVVIRPASA